MTMLPVARWRGSHRLRQLLIAALPLLIGASTACSLPPSAADSILVGTPALAPAMDPLIGPIVVFAASSLTDAFEEIGTAFERAHPGARVTFNFGASSQLRAQLTQGARADVFASADQQQMEAARRDGAVIGEDRVFARNRLVVITPRDNPRQITSVKDLSGEGVKLVATQPIVPIGRYTTDMLDRAAADRAYGPDWRARVERNVVSREDNVRQIVSKVRLGEADAGVVYSSDVTPRVRDQLQQVPVPDSLNTLATYPIAQTSGNNPAGGETFVRYVLSADAQDVLVTWGFVRAERP